MRAGGRVEQIIWVLWFTTGTLAFTQRDLGAMGRPWAGDGCDLTEDLTGSLWLHAGGGQGQKQGVQ